ncbi:hypothetical protein PC129_g10996 [Phytophthora cactorum]|uniref:Uncharacterized protein n=2 Tax=Phytophthora cactorum TaxID=29920 RepID=A0A329S2J6_9STRA|nr:hypothetical protein Pcac1_g15540 [Phytophthora cactorum]KAG2818409.1 hypothetical protein PC112_g12651 [Phytophthora cactorum]KAG2854621.1 hypothetical protein PC113_g13143 [Phytophthora cactorum]KAG2900079.1 hypothetical protein PC114_g13666 [Phytophthora cactorum]KAG2913438.1 hypothetical protein PC115_g12051 [Phytophthora cactorum]
MPTLEAIDLERISRSARVFVVVAAGNFDIVAERDEGNQPLDENNLSYSAVPGVLPQQLITMGMQEFVVILNKYNDRILKHYKREEHVELVGAEFKKLTCDAQKNETIRAMLQQNVDNDRGFIESWESIAATYPALTAFCAGVSCAIPNTATVESDFSILGWKRKQNIVDGLLT